MESGENSMERFHSSFGIPPIFGDSRNDGHILPQFSQTVTPQNSNKKVGMPPHPHPHPHLPPSSPYSMMPSPRSASQQLGMHNLSPRMSHSRSLSQPPFFSLDSFAPLSPPLVNVDYGISCSQSLSGGSMEERSNSCDAVASGSGLRVNQGLPPRKGHRRSNSDTPLGFATPQSIPVTSQVVSDEPIQLVKRESAWNKDSNNQTEGEVADELFRTYMNLDNMGTMNSPPTEDRDVDSMASEKKTNGNGGDNSDNEVESGINRITNSMLGTSLNLPSEKREGVKRRAGGEIAPSSRHYRSISMDSFMGSFNFDEETLKIQASLGTQINQLSPSNSMDGSLTKFSIDLGNGDFSGVELKKIMGNEKLAEIAVSDPKRVKRILANRESAARSKERKVRYISELEHKVQTLQAEATTLSAQVTVLQRDSAGLSTHNNELKFRIQAMEQQSQLREALHETLTAEVQRLKLAAAELRGGGEHHQSARPQFQLQNRRNAQMDMYQLQHSQQMSQQNGEKAKHG